MDYIYKETNGQFYSVISKTNSKYIFKVISYGKPYSGKYTIERCPTGDDNPNKTTTYIEPQQLEEYFGKWIERVKKYHNYNLENQITSDNKKNITMENNKSKIFIVHGHNKSLLTEVENLLRKADIEPVILSEKIRVGSTIIEKFLTEVSEGKINVAIVLLTADDLGRKKRARNLEPRARQNVIFELGYFYGKIGRENTIIIEDKSVVLGSDLEGLGTIRVKSQNWKSEVIDGLKSAGLNIDKNKITL